VPRKATKTKAKEEEPSGAIARGFWSGTITFGLVSIPVELYPGNRSNRASLRMLGPDGQPLSRRYYSEGTGRDLDGDQTVRGYEFEKDKFVVVTDDELERLAPAKSRDIDLRLFVDLSSVPPIYFDRAYFLAPAKDSDKAYRLLVQTMEESELAGIATFVMRGKEYLVAIFPENGILRAETMRFADELRSPADVGLPKWEDPPAATVKKLEAIIQKKAAKELPLSLLKDEKTERLMQLVQKKKKSSRKSVIKVEEPEEREEKGVDIMELLKKSLAGKKRKVA
jgi:DNA end-binding protein Ku